MVNNNKFKNCLKSGVCIIALMSMSLSYANATEITPETTMPGPAKMITWNQNAAMTTTMSDQEMTQTAELTPDHEKYFESALSLKDAIVLFLQKNPSIKKAHHNREAVQQERNQVKAEFLPTVDAEASTGREYKNRDAANPTTTERFISNFTIRGRQNLFRGFASVGQSKRQRLRTISASERISSQSEFRGLDAVESYVETYQQRELLEVSEANIQTHMATFVKIKDRVDAGTSNYAELNKAEARLELAKSTYYTNIDALQEAEARFESIIGVPPQKITRPELATQYLPKTIEEAIALAQLHNPNLLALKADIEAAEHNITVQTAGFFPTVDLELDATRSHNQSGVSEVDREIEGRVVGRYNLFNGGRDAALRKEAIARYEEAKSLYNEELKNVEQEIRTAWGIYQSTQTNVPIVKKYVSANVRVRDLYIEQFNLGKRSLLNVLDGENELFQSRRELITIMNSNVFAGYRLVATTGHLLKSFDVELPQAKAV